MLKHIGEVGFARRQPHQQTRVDVAGPCCHDQTLKWREAHGGIHRLSAPHRGEAFAGAREIIDRVKAEAPIWKKEVEGGEERWVEGRPPDGVAIMSDPRSRTSGSDQLAPPSPDRKSTDSVAFVPPVAGLKRMAFESSAG